MEKIEIHENTHFYTIESELGRLNIRTHTFQQDDSFSFSSAKEIFPNKNSNERYRSAKFDMLMLKLASALPSYRGAQDILNHIRHQDDRNGIKHRTLADNLEKEGKKLTEHIDRISKNILIENGFNPEKGTPQNVENFDLGDVKANVKSTRSDEISELVDKYNYEKEPKYQIDKIHIGDEIISLEDCVNISIDDVNTIQQKETDREKNSPPKDSRHYVKNTVIHVQHDEGKYVLNGIGMESVFIFLVAFLLSNALLKRKHIVFFADGADDIKLSIRNVFGWMEYRIILDWYHLKKKCQERLSMAMKGREIRNEALRDVLIFLWRGKVDETIEYLRGLDTNKIKNKSEIEKLIAYFKRNRANIPCYALRQLLGMRVSSNLVEKSNDLVVAKRQKRNGMSWSKDGSTAMATISSMFLNNESENWVKNRKLKFKLQKESVDSLVA